MSVVGGLVQPDSGAATRERATSGSIRTEIGSLGRKRPAGTAALWEHYAGTLTVRRWPDAVLQGDPQRSSRLAQRAFQICESRASLARAILWRVNSSPRHP
jgi:hypothetical protein